MKTLEEKIAVMQAAKDGKTIEYKPNNSTLWYELANQKWNWEQYDYRVKPVLKLVPRTIDDLPKGGALWVRRTGCSTRHAALVTYVGSCGIQVSPDCRAMIEKINLDYNENYNIEISADRVNWLPWWKEIKE